MTQIVATPAELFAAARSRQPAILIVLPHAYEACQSLRRLGSRYQFVRAAPSIAGKLALLSLEGAEASDGDLELFASLSPACGMKDGREVNTTGHVLPFDDVELMAAAPDMPIDERVGDYALQRAGDEWYYYETTTYVEQQVVLDYLFGLATLAATVKNEVSE
jgi:hypothetical protein